MNSMLLPVAPLQVHLYSQAELEWQLEVNVISQSGVLLDLPERGFLLYDFNIDTKPEDKQLVDGRRQAA